MSCKAVREDWRRVLKLTPIDVAVERLLKAINLKPRVEEVEVTSSLGRVLAEDVVASQDVPPYDGACFEGYAVRSGDTKELPVVRGGEAVL